jgi:hypothetical protein
MGALYICEIKGAIQNIFPKEATKQKHCVP